MNPVPLSFLLLDADGRAEWFVDSGKLATVDVSLLTTGGGLAISSPVDFLPRLAVRAAGRAVVIDTDFVPAAVAQAIRAAGGRLVEEADPITLAKALKTESELQGYRDCHLQDGVAMVEFLAWLQERVATGRPPSELHAEECLLGLRSARPGFLEASFRTISAAGANAAMCHYTASPRSDAMLVTTAPYLVDSGGQYTTGTTDVTRTVMSGPASEEMRLAYTAVLQGFIALHDARFPAGTMGHQLDVLARLPLWRLGLDYDHGTGHGVGCNLLVHEYPHRFAKKANPYGLVPGNIMTIEPGFYRAGSFGMRIENQVEVVADGPGFCRFSALTLVPIDLAMVDSQVLSPREISWIDRYHDRVRDRLCDLVSTNARDYLIRATRPLRKRSAMG